MSLRGTPLGARAVGWLLCVVAFFAVATQAASQEPRTTETAALPRPGMASDSGLPSVLSARDADLYRRIFALQAEGSWKAADRLIPRLSDSLLLGHVEFQRYMHPTAYRSSFAELDAWLAQYADHPGAERVYKLALKRKPASARRPQRPTHAGARLGYAPLPATYSYRSTRKRSAEERHAAARLLRQVRINVLNTRLTVTEKLLAGERARHLLDKVEIDSGRTEVATGWLYYGKPDKALALAEAAARRSGAKVPSAHWVAGMAAWRLERFAKAASHFEALAMAENAPADQRAAGGYWAARTALKLSTPAQASGWLRRAAEYRRTFYGLLARQALGLTEPSLTRTRGVPDNRILALLKYPEAQRAVALLQAGQNDEAAAEMNNLSGQLDRDGLAALTLLADRGRMPSLALRLAGHLAVEDDHASRPLVDAGLYPLPPWHPQSGFQVDRALLFALIRQESSFNPTARSHDGARGLMQLMPATARFIAGGRGDRSQLYEPGHNLDLGQAYILHLMEQQAIGDNLLHLTAAYNGGPGNLQKWQRHLDETGVADDPLLFIESLPSRETRHFIRRVLTNLWMYRLRLGQSAPSLATLAAGGWPRYRPLD